jgi:hypothetical protein
MLWFDSAERGWLGAASLASGMAVTFKLTSVVFPAALAVLTVLVVKQKGRRETGMDGVGLRRGVGLIALCAAPILPWMARSSIVVGNPVYPMFARWIPSKNFPAEVSTAFESYNRYMIWGNSLGNSLDLDARRVVLAIVALAVVLVGLLVFLRQRDPLHRRFTIVVTATIVVQLYAAGLYARYWTPLAAVLQIPILAFVLAKAGNVNRRVGQILVLGLTFLFAAREVPGWLRGDPATLILASVDGGRRQELQNDLVTLGPLYTRSNQEAAPGEAVLMGFHCAGFYIDGPSLCADTLDTALRLTDWDDFNEDLEELGVAYVIAPTVVAAGQPLPGAVGARSVTDFIRDDEYVMLNRLLEDRGELVATVSDQSLYRIRPSTPDGDG